MRTLPWTVEANPLGGVEIVDAEGVSLAVVGRFKATTLGRVQAAQDALLMAAAPELLAACQSAMATTAGANDDAVNRPLIEAAIRKAVGKV